MRMFSIPVHRQMIRRQNMKQPPTTYIQAARRPVPILTPESCPIKVEHRTQETYGNDLAQRPR